MGEKKTSSIQDNISVMFILNIFKKGWKLMVIFLLLGAAAAYAIAFLERCIIKTYGGTLCES